MLYKRVQSEMNTPNKTPNSIPTMKLFFRITLIFTFFALSIQDLIAQAPQISPVYFNNSANYMNQGQFNRLDIGTGIFLDTVFFGATAFTNPMKVAPNSHLLTSLNIFTSLRYQHLKFSFSYDLNTSKIGRTGGIYELSMRYQFDMNANVLDVLININSNT